MKFQAIKKVPCTIEGWDEFETIPKGVICETDIFDRVPVITYKDKMVCDYDSDMAKEYFKQIQ